MRTGRKKGNEKKAVVIARQSMIRLLPAPPSYCQFLVAFESVCLLSCACLSGSPVFQLPVEHADSAYCERQVSRLIDQTPPAPSRFPSGHGFRLSKYGDEIVQDSHLLLFSPDITSGTSRNSCRNYSAPPQRRALRVPRCRRNNCSLSTLILAYARGPRKKHVRRDSHSIISSPGIRAQTAQETGARSLSHTGTRS